MPRKSVAPPKKDPTVGRVTGRRFPVAQMYGRGTSGNQRRLPQSEQQGRGQNDPTGRRSTAPPRPRKSNYNRSPTPRKRSSSGQRAR